LIDVFNQELDRIDICFQKFELIDDAMASVIRYCEINPQDLIGFDGYTGYVDVRVSTEDKEAGDGAMSEIFHDNRTIVRIEQGELNLSETNYYSSFWESDPSYEEEFEFENENEEENEENNENQEESEEAHYGQGAKAMKKIEGFLEKFIRSIRK